MQLPQKGASATPETRRAAAGRALGRCQLAPFKLLQAPLNSAGARALLCRRIEDTMRLLGSGQKNVQHTTTARLFQVAHERAKTEKRNA